MAGEKLQNEIHEAIMSVGGYWPASNASTRLLEELGEVVDAMSVSAEALAEELADVWIISTCLANQYSAHLNYDNKNKIEKVQFESLVSQAGKIARTVNYYDGPKNPKKNETLQPVGELIGELHELLLQFAEQNEVDVIQSVKNKVAKIALRDKGRFGASYDPSSNRVKDDFQLVVNNTKCPFATAAKIWGARDWNIKMTVEENILTNHLNDFLRFIKIASHENIDAFVIAAPSECGKTIDHLKEFVGRALQCLAANDPTGYNCIKDPSDGVQSEGWHFQLNNQIFFITSFAPCYAENNARQNYGSRQVFLVFQPEHSFKQTKFLPVELKRKQRKRNHIRGLFADAGMQYDQAESMRQGEAAKYVKPLSPDDDVIAWWRPSAHVFLPGDKFYSSDDSQWAHFFDNMPSSPPCVML